MADIKQIVLVLIGCAVLIAGLLYLTTRETQAPQLLLNDDGSVIELEAPLSPEAIAENEQLAIKNTMNPVAVFTTSKGVFELELYADQMPITTGNFMTLIGEGFYDGMKFHRIIDGFMIQGGDPNSKGDDSSIYGTGGPGFTIQDEFVEGELLTNTRGSISMANTGQPNSGGSQFFINTVDNLALDFDKQPFTSKHPVFGRIVSGMDIIDIVSSVETGPRDLPVEPVVIESVTIKAEG
ncbi:MAG: peptidylprolyl isomerase [Patiriisocius sp.]|jgi:peptidylprolyl isomerase